MYQPGDKVAPVATVNAAQRSSPGHARRVLLAMDYYMRDVHRGAADFARRVGWLLDVRSPRFPQLPSGYEVEGILTFIDQTDLFGPAVRACNVPTVNMSPWGMEFGLPSVQMDNPAIGRTAAKHLIDQGFRDLGMVQFSATSLTSAARCQGFADAVKAAGRRFHSLVAPPTIDLTKAISPRMLQWLPEGINPLPKPLGLLAEGDAMAIEVIRVINRMGLRVPEDVAVLGIDNDSLIADSSPVPVSSVDSNQYELGLQAAGVLDRILRGEAVPAEPLRVVPRGVAQRQSTQFAPFASPEVAVAVEYIRRHFRESITVTDVAHEAMMSRRRLQDLFTEQLGRSILQEINRCRIELGQKLLIETPMKVSVIAEQCGLRNGAQMSKVFLRDLKITPSDYREQNTQGYRHGENAI